ncbi:MAG TPA: glycosyltransferase family 2 protein [Pyrinomonadaceae bacterium]|nr:glycosyltransferase family 2 protein [Pyrinomonadaceae bacterium]
MGSPLVSVIMPVCNEGEFIERTLEAVLTQDYASDLLEVLIADGMSTDATRKLITDVAARHPEIPVTILDNPGRRASTGLNVALQAARGDVIVRVDGHTIIEPDYVRQCVALLESREAQNVGGRMTAMGSSPFARAVALATSSWFGVGGARFHYSEREEWVDTVYLGAWPRELFQRVGLFDEEMVRNQDDEFNYRLLAHGGKILLSPKIKSRYYNRTSVQSLWSQYFQYGYWKVRVMQKHPLQMRLRQLAPAGFVLALLVSILLAPFSLASRLVSISLLALYLTVNLGASILVCVRKAEWKLLPSIPLAYAVIHFAYGTGFLIGLVRFWKRWGEPTRNLKSGNLSLPSGKQL